MEKCLPETKPSIKSYENVLRNIEVCDDKLQIL